VKRKPKSQDPKITAFLLLLIMSLVLASLRLILYFSPELFRERQPVYSFERQEELRFSLYHVLFEFGIRVEWISGDSYFKTVRIPKDLSIDATYAALISRFEELGGKILRAESNPDRVRKVIGFQEESLFELTLVTDKRIARVSGKIAIVIDDFGNSFGERIDNFLQLEHLINISVLPGLEFSEAISHQATENGLPVLLHLPMEAANGTHMQDDFMLLTSMKSEAVKPIVRRALKAVPDALGVNNHMGSAVTVTVPILEPLMDELKRNGMFFLDSMTNPDSRGFRVARQKGVPTTINNTFLDTIREEPFIRKQLHLLGEMASKNGQAIGIGHPYELTLKILIEEMPKLEKLGYQFVAVSELVK